MGLPVCVVISAFLIARLLESVYADCLWYDSIGDSMLVNASVVLHARMQLDS